MRDRSMPRCAASGLLLLVIAYACGGSTEPNVVGNNPPKAGENGPQTGLLSIWTDYASPISVLVNGTVVGVTSSALATAPSCGGAGTLTVTLPPGTHTLTATSGINNWSATVIVVAGGCTLYKLPAPVAPQTGQLSVWTDYTSPIAVAVDGTTAGTLSTYFTSTPSCGQAGTLTVSLAPGAHAIAGASGLLTWNGTVTIVAGQCTLFKLSAPVAAPSTGTLSIWTDYPTQISVRVDGSSVGATTSYFPTGEPTCGQAGTITLTVLAGAHNVTGTSGQNTWNGTATVASGRCTLFKLNSPASTTGTGTLSIWTNYPTQIAVRVDGNSVGTTTSYFPTGSPSCGQAGTITIARSAGVHTINGTSGQLVWNGTVTIVSDQCTLYELRAP